MKNKINNELKNNKQYLLISSLISVLTILPNFIFFVSWNRIVFLITLVVLLILLSKFSRIFFSIFIIYINVMNVVTLHISMQWGKFNKLEPIIELAYLSPVYESLEYMTDYIGYKDILIIIYTLIVIFVLYKYIIHYRHSYKILKVIGLSLFILIIGLISIYRDITAVMPFSLFHDYFVVKDRLDNYSIRDINIKNNKKTTQKNNKLIYDKVIIIMGESTNKHHLGIYGYEKNTTPFFSKLQESNQIYIFDVIAPAAQTRFAIPMNLTDAKVFNFYNGFLESQSIVTDFKDNGYKTYWISNQGSVGEHDSVISSMANEADISIFKNVYFAYAKPDEVLIDAINDIKTDNNSSQMFLVHLMGSHNSYKERYTTKRLLYKQPRNIIEEYDNTIYYTDYILEKLFNKFKNKKLLIIYTSDHGEVIHATKGGHGHFQPFKDNFDIPLVIYSNIKNKRIDEIFQKNKIKYFNNENLSNMINYISYITDESNISISSSVFTQDPKNIYNYNELNYSKDILK